MAAKRRKRPKKQPSKVSKAKQKKYSTNIFSIDEYLPNSFVENVQRLEEKTKTKIFILSQNDPDVFLGKLDPLLVKILLSKRSKLSKVKKSVAVLLHSPGGYAKEAYQIAQLFNKLYGSFVVIVPRYAKSAATLLALGASRIVMGEFAELGPLDAQYYDPEREQQVSALDEVQGLERLHAFSLEAVDRTMLLLKQRSGKKIKTLLPMIFKFVSDMLFPLFDKVDTVQYTKMSRGLRVAEEYAVRLLNSKYNQRDSESIARKLVEKYPDHGFLIDMEEALRIDAKLVNVPDAAENAILNNIMDDIDNVTAIGFLEKVTNEK